MEREERKLRRSRLWRGVTVVGLSLGLVVVSTTPSQAALLTLPTLPTSALPVVVAAEGITAAGAVGAASVSTACFLTVVCPLTVLAAGILMIAGAAIVYDNVIDPTEEVIGSDSGFYITQPPVTSSDGQTRTYTYAVPTDLPSDSFQAGGLVSLRKYSYNLGPCPQGASNCTNVGSNHIQYSLGTASPGSSQTHTTPTTSFGVYVQLGRNIESNNPLWETVLTYTHPTSNVDVAAAYPVAPDYSYVDTNPDRRTRTETRCTTPSGQSSINTSFSNIYKAGGTLPTIAPSCPTGSRPTGVAVLEQVKPSNSNVWSPAKTGPILPTQPTPACQPSSASATTLTCRPGLLFEAVFPDSIIAADWEHSVCVIGSSTCYANVVDPSGSTTVDCGETLCPAFLPALESVTNGTTTWQDHPFECRYNNASLPMSECESVLPQIAAASLPTPTPSPTPTPGGGLDGCGLSLTCYVSKLFTPTTQSNTARMTQVRTAFMATPFGVIPQAFNSLAAPFSLNTWQPNSTNCAGPTLTLPKNMGVQGTNASGNYVIQPLYACTDTPAGQFGANISGTIRAILTPTVYVTGAYVLVNTLLSAIGMTLPSFVRGSRDN